MAVVDGREFLDPTLAMLHGSREQVPSTGQQYTAYDGNVHNSMACAHVPTLVLIHTDDK